VKGTFGWTAVRITEWAKPVTGKRLASAPTIQVGFDVTAPAIQSTVTSMPMLGD
jgi:hypothetical protein